MEHLHGLERSNLRDFEKPLKRTFQKKDLNLPNKAKKASRSKHVKVNWMPDRIESFGKADSGKDRAKARRGFVKLRLGINVEQANLGRNGE